MASHVHRTWILRPAAPYDFAIAMRGHGWFDLAPHEWDDAGDVLTTAVAAGSRAFDVRVTASPSGAPRVRVTSARVPTRSEADRVRAGLRRMLRLDVDLAEFWAECARHEELAWVPRARAGHLMQSPTLFEDLLKILFTTNCSWSLTRSLSRNLVGALGPRAPSGRRAFPDAEVCAAQDEKFWRDVVRAGYRARHCIEISRGFADGTLRASDFEDPELPVDELRQRLLALPGFGPYAVGHALRGLGHYEDLALDSWCRAKMTELLGRRTAPRDSWFARRFRPFGRFAGLALWMELTADWHRAASFDARPRAADS